MGTFVPGGALQSSRPEGAQQGRHPRKHRKRRQRRRSRWELPRRRGGRAHSAAHHPPEQGYQQTIRDHTLGHRQILQNSVSCVLCVLQLDVLDHILAHF